MAETEVHLVQGLFRLVADVHGDQFVCSTLTGESCRLERSDAGVWEMQQGDNGVDFVFVEGTDREHWVPDLLKYNAYEANGEVAIDGVEFGSDLLDIRTFERLHYPYDVGIRHPGDAHVHILRVEAFLLRLAGQRFCWRLGQVIRIALLPFSTARRPTCAIILDKRQKAWARLRVK